MDHSIQRDLGDLVERLDHVAVAVGDIASAARLMASLGAEFHSGGDETTKSFRWVQFVLPGGGKIELLSPLPDSGPDHFLVRFLETRGEGMHHITLKVADLRAAIAVVEENGYRIVGAELDRTSWKEAFIHPKSSHGLLVQLAEWDDSVKVGAGALDEVLAGTPDGYET